MSVFTSTAATLKNASFPLGDAIFMAGTVAFIINRLSLATIVLHYVLYLIAHRKSWAMANSA